MKASLDRWNVTGLKLGPSAGPFPEDPRAVSLELRDAQYWFHLRSRFYNNLLIKTVILQSKLRYLKNEKTEDNPDVEF